MAERLSPEALRYAHAVSQTGSFSAAARAYGVTQPTLSNGIGRLEDQLGDRLFTRSPRGVTPTPFGLRMLPLIAQALSGLDAVSAEARRWTTPANETLRVGVSPLINPRVVANIYSAANSLGPTPRQLVLREANMGELRESLIDGDLDLVIVPSVAPMPRYEHRVIDSEPLVLIGRDSDAAGTAELADLAGKQLILMPDTCGLTAFTRGLLSDSHLPLRAYPGEASSYRVLEEWTNLGLGSAMLPESKLTDPTTSRRRVLDADGMEIEIFYEAVWDPDVATAADLRDLAESLAAPRAH